MFVMRREDFFKYCSVLFMLLAEFRQQIDLSTASLMNKRACAYAGEYFSGLYLYHLKKETKTIEVPRWLLLNTRPALKLKAAFSGKNIPIVFSIDDKYACYLCVCLFSLLKNASPDFNYDILILDGNISPYHKKYLSEFERENVSVRFIDVEPYLAGIDRKLFYLCSTHTISTYLRIFLPQILPDYQKILYLDPDTIILKDIVELYQEDIGDSWLGGTVDTGMLCNINDKTGNTKDTIKNVLRMDRSEEYMQAGVMLMNLTQLRENNFTKQCLECLKRVKTPRFVDQDIINSVCYKNIKWLDGRWNVEWHLPFFIKLYERLLPEKVYLKYIADRRNPSIIHYAGPKPWNGINQEFSDIFWNYCRRTPCYEEVLDKAWRAASLQIIRPLSEKIKALEEELQKSARQLPSPDSHPQAFIRAFLSKIRWDLLKRTANENRSK